MLVYLKEPMAATTIEGIFITGKYYNYGRYGPANIPRGVYLRNQNRLREIPITKEWLEEKFGGTAPVERFLYSDMHDISTPDLICLARFMGIKYVGRLTDKLDLHGRKGLYRSIRKALRDLDTR